MSDEYLISSASNPRYKALLRWMGEARARQQDGCCVLEGIHLLQVAREKKWPIQAIWLAQAASTHPEISELVDGSPTFQLTDGLWRQLSALQTQVGVLAVAALPHEVLPEQFQRSLLVLDRVQDPGNLGSMLRTAAAVGIDTVCCTVGCADVWSPKTLRAGMGAHVYLAIYDNLAEHDLHTVMLRSHTINRLSVCVTALQGAVDLYAADLAQPCCWVFGNEGRGVADWLSELATLRIRIPQPGGVESLNVAAAAAICLYEQYRQQCLK